MRRGKTTESASSLSIARLAGSRSDLPATQVVVGERDAHEDGTDSRRNSPLSQRVQLQAMSVPSRNVPLSAVPAPHFRLHSQVAASAHADHEPAGRWRFVLRSADGRTCLEAEDDEPESSTERLELLAIVRGLESLDGPARVTLVSAGRSISRGIRYGVAQWRENDWQWERYGKLTPVKNSDLWQRIDRAMAIHDVVCRDLPPSSDDLAGSIPTRSVFEGTHEVADVGVIHRTHRGRRLRFDRGQPTANATRQASQSPTPGWAHWLAQATEYFASLLRPIFRPSRPRMQSKST